MRRTLYRIAGTALAFGFAMLALGSGLNRMSATYFAAAERTPSMLRAQAARTLAAKAMAANDLQAAHREARLAVLHDPIDTESLSVLGQVALGAGQAEAARAAFTLSGQLGWRDPATQAYWLASALQVGEIDAAARRLDAILRQQPLLPERAALLGLFEASEAGQFRLAERLRLRPAWAVPYFHVLKDLATTSLAARGAVAAELAATYGLRDCAMVAPLVGALVGANMHDVAHLAWAAHCPAPGSKALIADGGFENARLGQPPTPFDWQFSADGAISIALEAAPDFAGQALTLASDAPGERSVASRLIRLPAGHYTASWRALDGADNPATSVGIAVSCSANARRSLPAVLRDARTGLFSAAFDIATNCPTQWLSLGIAAKADRVTLDDVAITRNYTKRPLN